LNSSITRIQTERPTLQAFQVSSKITKADIEWMADELKTAFAAQGEVDMLILIKQWDGIEIGAVFDAKSISAQAEANSHVRRYAVVGAPTWAKAMINLFSPLTPIEEKTFELSEVDKAWAWILS
jgi:hypothetical protein